MYQPQTLLQRLKQEIEQSGGAIPFSRYMTLALYATEGGYYTSPKPKFGRQGDFITAPLLSPLFSQCLASQVWEILEQILRADLRENRQADVLEFGAGTGRMAGDILSTLVAEQGFAGRYAILEASDALRAEQQLYLQGAFPDLFDRFYWLDKLPENFVGVVLANEVLDAFPVERFTIRNGELLRNFVAVAAEKELEPPVSRKASEANPEDDNMRALYANQIYRFPTKRADQRTINCSRS